MVPENSHAQPEASLVRDHLKAMNEWSTARQCIDPATEHDDSEEEFPNLCNHKPCMTS